MTPEVSVIIPCLNEEATIGLLLESLWSQTYPPGKMEVIIADGGSTDQTRQRIAAFQQSHPELVVKVVDNPQRIIPAALNRAIAAAAGAYLVRMDAHAFPYPDYIERCLDALKAGLGDNVGGVWEIQPHPAAAGQTNPIARGIAAAAAHPLGVGDALYRYASQAKAVDTVPFGAFHHSLIQRIGGYDESLLTNEDYEFNTRILQSGGIVWLDPAIRSVYYARPSLPALARQYLRYGYWKAQMLRRYPNTLRWRQYLPPLFVLGLLGLALLAPFSSLAGGLLLAQVGGYLLILTAAGIQQALHRNDGCLVYSLPLSIMVMHLCWGAALLWGLAFPKREKKRNVERLV